MEKTIDNEIKTLMEDFIVNEMQKMIDNNKFNSIHDIEEKNFGEYNIKLRSGEIIFRYNTNNFYFPSVKIIEYRNKFLGIEYGKIVKKKLLTRVGKIREQYINAYSNYEEIIKNQEKIDALPEEIKKNILRRRKFKNIIN